MRSIIFFDIDGTLITEDARMFIPESAREAIKRTRELGNLAFINSGRTAFNISSRVREVGFDGIICGCGTYIECDGKLVYRHTLEQPFCREIAALMRKCNVTPVYEHTDGYFFDDKTPVTDDLRDFLENFVEEGIDITGRVEDEGFIFDKFVIWVNENSDFELFRKEIGKNFSIIDRGNGFYENVPLGCTKATAIDKVLEMYGIPRENAYAIGDSMNDLPMLEAVPNSIAMGGAECLYPYVSYITTPIEEDGIENALRHYDLIR